MTLNPDRLYMGDNGRITCGGRCAGASAQLTGIGISGHPVTPVGPAIVQEFAEADLPLRCEDCGKGHSS